MSASSTPTFMPRSRSPSARLTAVVDLPTPPLPEATAMIALTPGTPDGPSPPWPRGGGRSARLAFGGQRHHRGLHARKGLHGLLGALSHRLPGLDHGGVDG